MVVGAKVCDLTEDLLWYVCGLYVGILTSSLIQTQMCFVKSRSHVGKYGFEVDHSQRNSTF